MRAALEEYVDIVRSPEIASLRKSQSDMQYDLLGKAFGGDPGLFFGGPLGLLGFGAKYTWDYIKDKTADYTNKF